MTGHMGGNLCTKNSCSYSTPYIFGLLHKACRDMAGDYYRQFVTKSLDGATTDLMHELCRQP